MTIAASFKCSEGWIIATDSQETISDYSKTNIDKIRHLEVSQDWRIVFSAAGHSNYADMLQWRIEKACKTAKTLDIDVAEQIITDELLALHEKHIWSQQRDRSIEALILVQRKNLYLGWEGVRMFATSDSAVFPVDDYRAIGIGAHMADYLFALCFKSLWPGVLSRHAVERAAVYMLKEIKGSIHGCDGESLIGFFDLDGSFEYVRTREVERLEKSFRGLDEVFKSLFAGCTNPNLTEAEFAQEIQTCQENLLRIRKEQMNALADKMGG